MRHQSGDYFAIFFVESPESTRRTQLHKRLRPALGGASGRAARAGGASGRRERVARSDGVQMGRYWEVGTVHAGLVRAGGGWLRRERATRRAAGVRLITLDY